MLDDESLAGTMVNYCCNSSPSLFCNGQRLGIAPNPGMFSVLTRLPPNFYAVSWVEHN
ncbi:hypothetical protein M378DRAFT_361475 [Amanita muscaria Koide BX008]|uniref:Uncharacterized protein n=1 Tax=Amanita muscaria (strain Koide BX008) TaxID=946122 RepID=A0A0C2S4X5_AMAMK|nr:hypothetical protein M378DRAFT_361475 [Amanita muscaria Koide BX008]